MKTPKVEQNPPLLPPPPLLNLLPLLLPHKSRHPRTYPLLTQLPMAGTHQLASCRVGWWFMDWLALLAPVLLFVLGPSSLAFATTATGTRIPAPQAPADEAAMAVFSHGATYANCISSGFISVRSSSSSSEPRPYRFFSWLGERKVMSSPSLRRFIGLDLVLVGVEVVEGWEDHRR